MTFCLKTEKIVVEVPTIEIYSFDLVINRRGRRKKISNRMKACKKYDSFDPSNCNSKKRVDIYDDIVGCSSKFGQTSMMIDEEDLWIKNVNEIYVLNFCRCK